MDFRRLAKKTPCPGTATALEMNDTHAMVQLNILYFSGQGLTKATLSSGKKGSIG